MAIESHCQKPSGRPSSRRVLIVEDHQLFCDALAGVIGRAMPGADISQATTIDQALSLLSGKKPVDLVLLDLAMPGTSGLLGLFQIRKRSPRAAVVVVSAYEDTGVIGSVLSLGAIGFIPKSASKHEMSRQIDQALQGSVSVPNHLRADLLSWQGSEEFYALIDRLHRLTLQQLRVLDLIGKGLQNKQIAHELGISITTVKVHVTDVLRNLGVRSRTEAIVELSRIDFPKLSVQGDKSNFPSTRPP